MNNRSVRGSRTCSSCIRQNSHVLPPHPHHPNMAYIYQDKLIFQCVRAFLSGQAHEGQDAASHLSFTRPLLVVSIRQNRSFRRWRRRKPLPRTWLKVSRLCKFYAVSAQRCIKNIRHCFWVKFKIIFIFSILSEISGFGTRLAIIKSKNVRNSGQHRKYLPTGG